MHSFSSCPTIPNGLPGPSLEPSGTLHGLVPSQYEIKRFRDAEAKSSLQWHIGQLAAALPLAVCHYHGFMSLSPALDLCRQLLRQPNLN